MQSEQYFLSWLLYWSAGRERGNFIVVKYIILNIKQEKTCLYLYYTSAMYCIENKWGSVLFEVIKHLLVFHYFSLYIAL